MVKILEHDISEKNFTDAHIIDRRRLSGIRLCFGDPLADRFPSSYRVKIESEAEPNDFFYAGPMPVASEHFKGLLDSFKANVEYFKLEVELQDGSKSKTAYYYPNILDVFDCLDWDASTYTRGKKIAMDLKKIVLREALTKKAPFFLIGRTDTVLICVRDDVADAFQKSPARGIILQDPIDWKDRAYPS